LLGLNGASRRRTGIAAAIVLAGGLAGSALLAPTSAFAGVMQVGTTTSITGTQQADASGGTTLAVKVSVSTPAGSPLAPAGSVKVTIAGTSDSCTTALTVPSSASDLTSTGSCDISSLAGGHYDLKAAYTSSTMQFGSSDTSGYWVTVSSQHRQSLSTKLSCPQQVTTGHRGTCTLSVTDNGWGAATGVRASISLPSALSARSCSTNANSGSGHPWGWQPCSISKNVASANLGTIWAGQTKKLSVTFTGHLSSWQQNHGRMNRVWVHGSAWDNNKYSSASAAVVIMPQLYW
jgi:hypothetical protein